VLGIFCRWLQIFYGCKKPRIEGWNFVKILQDGIKKTPHGNQPRGANLNYKPNLETLLIYNTYKGGKGFFIFINYLYVNF
jgi:hypothetical protein